MMAVLKDAIMNYKKRMHLGSALFKEAETWLFERERDWLFSFETVCAVLGLSPGKIRSELIAWKLNAMSNLSGERPQLDRGLLPCGTGTDHCQVVLSIHSCNFFSP
jgi:hypothetical protein